MMWGTYGMGGWAWGFGALVLVGLVILVIVLVRMFAPSRPVPPPPPPQQSSSLLPDSSPSPKQILDERYARGEVTTEEYQERRSALGLDS